MGLAFLAPFAAEIALKNPIAEQNEDEKETKKTGKDDPDQRDKIEFKRR